MTEKNIDRDEIFKMIKEEKYYQFAEFHSQEAIALQMKYNHIEKLIGTNHHNPTAGYHCEMLIKEYLRANLPAHYSIDTGFIRCNPQDVTFIDENGDENFDCVISSPQIDILIHNETIKAPIYRTGDYVIVEPETVVAIIEIKKKLTKIDLLKSLNNLTEANYVVSPDRFITPENIFFGILGFDTSLGKNFSSFKDVLSQYCYNGRFIPNTITVLSSFCSRINYNKDNGYDIKIWDSYSSDKKLLLSLQVFLFLLKEKIGLSNISRFNDHIFPYLSLRETFSLKKSK